MEIKLITSDFAGANYGSNTDCPLARAVKRTIPDRSEYIQEGDFGVGGTYVRFGEAYYTFDDLKWDGPTCRDLVSRANAGEEVTFTLEVQGLENALKS